MFSLAIIVSCVLVTLTGPSVKCYTISRTQDYSGYNPSGFIGLKDSQEHLGTSNYQQSNTHRYSPISGGHSSSISYPEASHSSSYGGHSSPSTPESLNTITSSYQSDSSADLSQSYSSNPQSIEYSSSSSPHASSGSVSFSGYAGSSGGGGGQSASDIDYSSGQSSPSYSASAGLSSYTGGKASAYPQTANQHNSPYSSGSSAANYVHSSAGPSPGHSSTYPGSYTGSFSNGRHPASIYQAEHSQNNYNDGPKFAPTSALKSYLSNLHREAPGGYHAAALTHTPNYAHPPASSATYSKNPGPYFSGGFPKGQKIIIIKDGAGAHAPPMHPEHNFPSGMFSGGSGYKVRSSGTPYSSGHYYPTPSASYNHPVYTSGHAGAGSSSSYFGFS